jgi:hypothetical protein
MAAGDVAPSAAAPGRTELSDDELAGALSNDSSDSSAGSLRSNLLLPPPNVPRDGERLIMRNRPKPTSTSDWRRSRQRASHQERHPASNTAYGLSITRQQRFRKDARQRSLDEMRHVGGDSPSDGEKPPLPQRSHSMDLRPHAGTKRPRSESDASLSSCSDT